MLKGDGARVVLKDIGNQLLSPDPPVVVAINEDDDEPSPIPAIKATTNLITCPSPMGK